MCVVYGYSISVLLNSRFLLLSGARGLSSTKNPSQQTRKILLLNWIMPHKKCANGWSQNDKHKRYKKAITQNVLLKLVGELG